MLTFKAFMLEDAEKFASFHALKEDRNYIAADTAATEARNLAGELCEKEVQDLEHQKLARKKVFLAHHQLDYKDYTATFKRNYPARDLIFEEIGEMTKKFVRSRVLDWSSQLTLEHGRRTQNVPQPFTAERAAEMNKGWWEYRSNLLKREVPNGIRELRGKVRVLPSVKEMAAKVAVN